MDDFEQPGTSKLGDEMGLNPNNVIPTRGAPSQTEQELSAGMTQVPIAEPSHPRRKCKKKVVLVISTVVLVLALVGGVVWFVLANNKSLGNADEGVTNQPGQSGNNDSGTPAVEPESKDEAVELSVDDELVQRLYRQFDFTLSRFIWTELFGNVSDETKLRFAIASQKLTTICKDQYGTLYGEGEYDPNTFAEPWPIRGERCVDGGAVRTTIRTVFGSEITLTNKQITGIHCSVFYMMRAMTSLST